MDGVRHFWVAVERYHLRETALQFVDEVCALLLGIGFAFDKAQIQRIVNFGALAGEIAVAIVGVHRKAEQRANKDRFGIVLIKERFQIDHVGDHDCPPYDPRFVSNYSTFKSANMTLARSFQLLSRRRQCVFGVIQNGPSAIVLWVSSPLSLVSKACDQ